MTSPEIIPSGSVRFDVAPHTVSVCEDGAILCQYADGIGDYKVDCGTVLLSLSLMELAAKLGWHNLGARTDAEREASLVRAHRTYGEAVEQFQKLSSFGALRRWNT